MQEPMIRPWCPCVGHGVLPLSQGEGRQPHPYIYIMLRSALEMLLVVAQDGELLHLRHLVTVSRYHVFTQHQ